MKLLHPSSGKKTFKMKLKFAVVNEYTCKVTSCDVGHKRLLQFWTPLRVHYEGGGVTVAGTGTVHLAADSG
jgi:hypothetical protein